jgi:hypothetical protein
MSDFLTRLAERQLGQSPSLRPNVPATFAPVASQHGLPELDARGAEWEVSGARPAPSPPEVANPWPRPRPARPSRPPAWAAPRDGAPDPEAVTAFPSEARRTPPPRPHASDEPARSEPVLAPRERASERPAALPRPSAVAAPSPAPHRSLPPPTPPPSAPAPTTELMRERTARESSTVRPTPLEPALSDVPRRALATLPRLVEASSERAPADPIAAPQRLGSVPAPLSLRVATRETTRVEGAGSERTIHVSIGRIRVTAAAAPPRPPRPAGPPKPRLTLADYLSQRQRGER